MKNGKLFQWSVVATLAGFLFGFDTVVISGANLPIKELWHTSNWFHGIFIMSMALWGTVVGALLSGWPTEKYGRKKVLLWTGIFYVISAAGTAFALDPYSFSLFRFIGGLGIGISSVVAPTYISEISTPGIRGRLVAMYQFNIVFGILIAFLSNYLLKGVSGSNDWRWMMGVSGIPSLLYVMMVIGLPESPRWLITRKNDKEKAKNILTQMGVQNTDLEISNIIEGNRSIQAKQKINFFSAKYSTPILLAFFIAFFNQLSGINFILYYAPEILERAGLAEKESLFNSIAIGGVNLVFTFIGLYLIDRMGRRKLLILGSFGYIISLAMVAYSFYSHASPEFLMTFLLLFIASHAIGQGAVIWVFIAEIFPNNVRAIGQSFGAGVHWVFAAIISSITPVFLNANTGILKDKPWIIFLFFAGMMVLQLLWVLTKVPETKGVSLEELEKKLIDN